MTPRIVAIIEAKTVTGPAKNLIRFASDNRARFDFYFVTYVRAPSAAQAASHSNTFIDTARKAGIPVSTVWEKSRLDRAVLTRLTDCIRSLQPQIVQTHSLKSHFLLSRVRNKLALPWIAFHHGYTNEGLKIQLFNLLDRFSLPLATEVVTVCQAFARDIERYGIASDRIRILHNSLNPAWAQRPGLAEEATTIRSNLPNAGRGSVLLCVGRFSTEKGHSVLVKAISALREFSPSSGPGSGFNLVLIGDGPLRSAVEQQVRTQHLQDRVIFAGQQRDVRPYFAACDLLVLPSLSEGSPNVLLEAMAARLPIVATSVGGIPEIVSDEDTALLVSANDVPGLTAALARLLQDRALGQRLAERAHQRLIQHFSPAEYDNNLSSIYRSILARSSQQASDPATGASVSQSPGLEEPSNAPPSSPRA